MPSPLLRPTRLAAVAALLLAACATEGAPPGEGAGDPLRPPGAVGDKPIVMTPRGPAIADALVARLVVPDDRAAGRLAAELGGEVAWRGPRTGAYVLRFPGADETSRALADLARRPEVLDAGRQLVARGTGVGSSPGIEDQWNLPAMMLSRRFGWGSAEGILVAVIDTGVAYEDRQDATGSYVLAPDLAGVEFAPGYDFVNDDAHPNDDHGHGTHVAGIIASTGPLRAIAPGAAIMPIKVLGADNLGTELGLAEGILHAAAGGADVINLSLSFSPAYFPSRLLQDAVDQAAASGALIVAAVGNHGQDVVTYPAAFREVLAVGASSLAERRGHGRWWKGLHRLERAPYSNRGYLIDVTAPGGRIDTDFDRDGNPDGILAQSFTADPTELEYLYYAGTSQAAAQISGLAAVMLGESDREASAGDVRALLGETARRGFFEPLGLDLGRGHVRGGLAILLADTPLVTAPRPRFSTAVRLALVDDGGVRRARAVVEVIDEDGAPARKVAVHGSFTGGVVESRVAITDRHGRVELTSGPLVDPRLVAFQVDAVVSRRGFRTVVDRPGGFVRIDSCSLDLISDFGEVLAGSGVGSSPGAPISLATPALAPDELDSVLLMNFSWAGATPAMAVVADAGWFEASYPDFAETRVVSLGSGLVGSPLAFDAAGSFPVVLDGDAGAECVDLVVQTFTGSGVGSSPGVVPVLPDPDGSCAQNTRCAVYRAVIEALWWAELTGEEPVLIGNASQATPEEVEHLRAVVAGYASFGADPLAAPVGEYGETLDAAGLGLTPFGGGTPPDELGAGSALWQ